MSKRSRRAAPAQPGPRASGGASAPPTAAAPAPAPRSRRWRRWLLIVVALLVVLRVGFTLALPMVVRSALDRAGLRGEYDDLSISLLGGSLELQGVQLWPVNDTRVAPPAEAPLRLALARVDLALLPLITARGIVEEVTVTGLHVAAERTADGRVVVAGWSLSGGADDAPAPPEPAAETPPAAESPPSDEPGRLLALDQLAVTDIVLAWTDAALQPPVVTSLRLDLTGAQLQWGPGASESRFELALAVPGDCGRLALLGTLHGDPDALALDARLELRGLRAGPLARYLPPGVANEMQAGAADAHLTVGWAADSQGGGAAHVELTDFVLQDEAGPPLLAFDALRLNAPRLDAAQGVFELSDLVLMGLRGRARLDASGGLHVLGFSFAAGAPAADPAPAASGASASASETASESVSTPATASAAPPLPRVSLERLDLELAEFTFTDESQAGAAPLVAGLRLQNREPLRLLDTALEDLPPLRLLLTGRALPVAQSLRVELEAAPWQSPATLSVGLELSGLRGEGLTALRPELAATLDGSGLADGRLSVQLRAELDLRRHGAQFDLSQGFAARLAVHDLALRAAPEGAVLVGLKGLELEAPRIDPAGGLVHVRSLDLDTPQAVVRRDAAGLHVAGLLLRAPAEAATDATAKTAEEAAAEPAAEATADAATATPAAAPAGPEVRVDRLTLHGLDLGLSDETSTPPCVIALNALDIEVRRFTTLAFVEPKPIRFSLFLGAGEIELPRTSKSSSVFAGLASAAALAVTGNEDEVQFERRPAFGEVALTGTLRLAPALTGNLRFGLSGFELPALAGPASAAGVEIGDGLFDATVTVRFRGEQGLDLDSRLKFTDLSLSEPADGPIATYLKLPAPLDSVLFLLRNERGEQLINFDLSVPADGIGGGRVAAAAGEAIGAVIGRAVAAVPARMLTSVTDLVGVTGGEAGPPQPELALVFAPGSTALPEVSLKDLRNALTRLRSQDGALLSLEHRLGQADLARADQLGNPSVEQCTLRAAQLRQQRTELLRRQAECSAEARAMLLVGRSADAESARARLIEAEQQVCLTEAALDSVFERLRPGAERYREQRARVAALQIGQARLEAVRRALLALGLPGVESRIELRPPRLDPIEGEDGGTVLATLKGG